MKIYWNISQTDIDKVKKVIADNKNSLLLSRQIRNVKKQNIVLDKEIVVKKMIMCLLTSQQRSGPNSAVRQFLRLEQFPITIEKLTSNNNVEEFIKNTLIQNNLTRYVNKISSFFASNFSQMVDSNWTLIRELEDLKISNSKIKERDFADKLANDFIGFGPKQSRNFLQSLGLTKYEIPIDSRIMTWLKDFGFPVTLTTSALGDKGYYHFILDGIQELCEKAEIYPCILDAAIFSSFDNGEWIDENTIY